MDTESAEVLERQLNDLTVKVDRMQDTLDSILLLVTNVVTEAGPILEKLSTSPLVKMLGGRKHE